MLIVTREIIQVFHMSEIFSRQINKDHYILPLWFVIKLIQLFQMRRYEARERFELEFRDEFLIQ